MNVSRGKLLLIATSLVAGILVCLLMLDTRQAPQSASTMALVIPAAKNVQAQPGAEVANVPPLAGLTSITVNGVTCKVSPAVELAKSGITFSNLTARPTQVQAPGAGRQGLDSSTQEIDPVPPKAIHIHVPAQQYPIDVDVLDAIGGAYPGVGTLGQPSRHLLDMRAGPGMDANFRAK